MSTSYIVVKKHIAFGSEVRSYFGPFTKEEAQRYIDRQPKLISVKCKIIPLNPG